MGRLSYHPGRLNDVIVRLVTYKRDAGRSKTWKQEAETRVTELCTKEGPHQLDEARTRVLPWSFQKEPALLTPAWFLGLQPSEL